MSTEGEVELLLWEPSAVNRPEWPITAGVPFPKGALKDEGQVCLLDGDRELPVAGRATVRWDDGSVRWLLLDFQVDLAGNERKRLTLRHGEGVASHARPSRAVQVADTEDGITVDNGDLRLIFRPGGRMPFDDLLYQGRSVLKDNAPFCGVVEQGRKLFATGGSVKVSVEDRNAFRAVVRCDGKFTAGDGAALLDLTTRVYVYAGKPFLRVFHTLTNREGRDVYLDDLSVRIPAALKEVSASYVTGQGLDASIHQAQEGRASVEIKTVPIPETKYSGKTLYPHVACRDRLPEIDGTMERRADDPCIVRAGEGQERAIPGESLLNPILGSGSVCGDGLRVTLACRNFYPQAPKRIDVEGPDIELKLYWNFDNTPLHLWRGTAKTHELHLVVTDGGVMSDREAVLAHKRLILALEEPVGPTFGESNWLQKTGVFGPLFDYSPEKFPWMEFMFRRIFEAWFSNTASALRGSTILDYGDYWNAGRGGQWQNNEMDFPGAMLLYMLRTGYPRPFSSVEAMIHHMIDVDTHHEASDAWWVGAQRYHQVRHGAFSPPALCHQWLEGPLYYYLLTGYERAREVALMRADHFCRAVEEGRHRIKQLERVQGWPLVALSTVNEHFPSKRYVKACDAILDWLEQWMEEDGDLVYAYAGPIVEGGKGGSILGRGVICQALAHYHRMTGNPRAWRLLLACMELGKKSLFTPEGLGVKTSILRRNYYAPGESDFILEALGYLWEQTGDEAWMRLGLLNFKLAVIQRDPIKGTHMGVGGGACEPYRFWPPFLYYAEKSGMLEDLRVL